MLRCLVIVIAVQCVVPLVTIAWSYFDPQFKGAYVGGAMTAVAIIVAMSDYSRQVGIKPSARFLVGFGLGVGVINLVLNLAFGGFVLWLNGLTVTLAGAMAALNMSTDGLSNGVEPALFVPVSLTVSIALFAMFAGWFLTRKLPVGDKAVFE